MINLSSALGAPSMNYFSKLTNPPILLLSESISQPLFNYKKFFLQELGQSLELDGFHGAVIEEY